MNHITTYLQSHPAGTAASQSVARCIDACFDCAEACTVCADACLCEHEVQALSSCIRTEMDCAEICTATGRVLSRQHSSEPKLLRSQLQACRIACSVSATHCEAKQDEYEHCRICAEACRLCEARCQEVLQTL